MVCDLLNGGIFSLISYFSCCRSVCGSQYKLVQAIRNGWIRMDDSDEEDTKTKGDGTYLLWADDGSSSAPDRGRKAPPPITAPKPKLPGMFLILV
jgi:hypothetical protein